MNGQFVAHDTRANPVSRGDERWAYDVSYNRLAAPFPSRKLRHHMFMGRIKCVPHKRFTLLLLD
jgi:hypothetical protein